MVLVAGMGMLCKRHVVTHAMAGDACQILLHRLVRQLMLLGDWSMLLAADEEAVKYHRSHKALLKSAVHRVMAQEISNKMSDATNAWAKA